MNSRPPQESDRLDMPNVRPARDELGRRNTATHRDLSGSSAGSTLLGWIAMLVAGAAIAAAYYLWQNLNLMADDLSLAANRIASLESQLINTGDELNQSDAAVRVSLKAVDTEVRRLEQNRRVHKTSLDKHEKSIGSLSASLKEQKKTASSLSASLKSTTAQLTSLSAEIDEMSEVLSGGSIAEQREQLQNTITKLNQLIRNVEQLETRVAANEEWVDSINAFRKQVNQQLNATAVPATPQLQ